MTLRGIEEDILLALPQVQKVASEREPVNKSKRA